MSEHETKFYGPFDKEYEPLLNEVEGLGALFVSADDRYSNVPKLQMTFNGFSVWLREEKYKEEGKWYAIIQGGDGAYGETGREAIQKAAQLQIERMEKYLDDVRRQLLEDV